MHAAIARCLRDHKELPLPLPLLQAVWGGGEGRPHASLAIAGLDSDDNRNGDCLSKKGWTREKERGNLMVVLGRMANLK